MDKKIYTLRTAFRISTAAFDFANAVQSAFNGVIIPNKMHQLHKIALEEIEKESPDFIKIDGLLAEMERLAESHTNSEGNKSKI